MALFNSLLDKEESETTGVTIDHMVSLVVLLTVIMLSMGAYSQIISAAIEYQEHHEIAMKASELADALLLSPGCPVDWSSNNATPSALGLQNSEEGGYSLSPFSLQRLLSPQTAVYFNKTGLWYSNCSLGRGGTLLIPLENTINYTTAAKLLGVNRTYGFGLEATPSLNIAITEVNLNPLRLRADVTHSSLPLAGATLNSYVFNAVPQAGQYPLIQVFSKSGQTNSSGSAVLEFSSVDGSSYAHAVVIYARLHGLAGAGFYRRENTNNKIVPFVEDPENRTVVLAHSSDVINSPPPVAALQFNATFFLLAQNFELQQIPLTHYRDLVSYGEVKYGASYSLVRVQIPTPQPGVLLVAYRWQSNFGIVMMPWGVNSLAFPAVFGGDSSNTDWVATELRLVVIDNITYQVKVSVWSIKGREIEV